LANQESQAFESFLTGNTLSTGISPFLKEWKNSSAIFPLLQGGLNLVMAAVNLTTHHYMQAGIWGLFTLGSVGVSAIEHGASIKAPRSEWIGETYAKKIWRGISAPIRRVLSEPGITYGIGNIINTLYNSDLDQLLADPLKAVVFGSGVSVMAAAPISGFIFKQPGLSTKIAGCGLLCSGISAAILIGPDLISIANFIWGWSLLSAGMQKSKHD
ncbi:MAG: hypothetical protein KDD42_06200, partial [Bdellovibrionales bacterium]|nr:hypothetical protein [Bdellovibrionales bacterium]